MNKRRDEVLGLLGLERWSLRAPAHVSETFISAAKTVLQPAAGSAATAMPVLPPAVLQVQQPASGSAPGAERIAHLDWPALRAAVAGCTACKLCSTRTHTVFGVGDAKARLMVVGEGPGADEDASGEPFVGRAGKLLDEMLKAIGRSRLSDGGSVDSSVFIANVVKCRPPGNRDPEKDEVEACRHYLDAQIAHVQPRLIVALGRIAAQRLLGSDEPLSRLRGPLHAYGKSQTPVFVTYHPAYLLRAPKEKAKSWEDLKKIAQHLKAHD